MQTDWAAEAATIQAPVFPIRITWDAAKQKWAKRPLTRHGHKDALHDVSRFDWSGANGFGIATGAGIYAIDLDTYKDGCEAEQWLRKWEVPMATRTHQTVSGGRHLLYSLPQGFQNIRSRQNVVMGLDTRGAGGWIAFGEGYTMCNAAPLAILGRDVCVELAHRPVSDVAVSLPKVGIVDAERTLGRLKSALAFSKRLRDRWEGNDVGLTDGTCSSFDMSAAKLLDFAGFSYDEIYWLLLTEFEHGVAARDGETPIVDRALKRVAAKATSARGDFSPLMAEAFGHGR